MTIRRLSLPIAAAAAVLGLAGCMGAPVGGVGPTPLNPAARFSLQVEPGIDRIALAVHEQGLSGAQDAALNALVSRFAEQGGGVLTIEAPAGNDPVSNAFAWRVRDTLAQRGAAGRVQVGAYAAPDPRAPVLVGFETLRAVVPQCGTSWPSLSRTASNDVSANFGCAVTANLAAQIANPRDIVTPRSMPMGDTGRRAVVFDHYRRGEATAAPQEELVQKGRVSQAVD